MGRVRRYVKRIQIGITEKLESVLKELIGDRQTPYQYFIEELLYKAYEEKQGKRHNKFRSISPRIIPVDSQVGQTLPDGTVITQEMLNLEAEGVDQYEEEQEKIRNQYEQAEKEDQKPDKNLKEVYAFKFRTSPVLNKKMWGKIGILPVHLIESYSKDKNVRILRTSKEMQKAKKELEEIQEFVVKKQLELDRKHGPDRNSPEWILAWEKIDPT